MRIVFWVLSWFCFFEIASAEQVLRSIAEVNAFTGDLDGVKFELEGEILLLSEDRHSGFLQHEGRGIFFHSKRRAQTSRKLGDIVQVRGELRLGYYRTHLYVNKMELLRTGERSEPTELQAAELIAPSADCKWVTFEGMLTRLVNHVEKPYFYAVLQWRGNELSVRLMEAPGLMERLQADMHRRVRISAITTTRTNHLKQFATRYFQLASIEDWEVIELPEGPRQSIDSLLRWPSDNSGAVHLEGQVIRVSGRELFLHENGKSIRVYLPTEMDLTPGDVITVRGTVEPASFMPFVYAYDVVKIGSSSTVSPVEIPEVTIDFPGYLHNSLVKIRAEVQSMSSGSEQRILYCRRGSEDFKVALKRDVELADGVQSGAVLEITGICELLGREPVVDKRQAAKNFRIMVVDAADVAVVEAAPWWTPQRLLQLIIGVVIAAVLAAAWAFLLRRKVRQQSEVIAAQVKRETLHRERQHFARELHDTLLQNLTGISLRVENMQAKSATASTKSQQEELGNVKEMIATSQKETRDAIRELRSTTSTRGSLAVYLEDELDQKCRNHGVALDLQTKGEPYALDSFVIRQSLKIIHEAANNALKHAQAKTLSIEFCYLKDYLEVIIKDDGRGFAATDSDQPGRYGIIGMKERAELIDADFEVSSSPGRGTTVSFQIDREPSLRS